MRGRAGNDVIIGLDGGDALFGKGGRDIVFGGAGNDAISGRGGNDTLFGGSGNDALIGNGGSDQLYVGAGNDLLTASRRGSLLDGGDGNDALVGSNNGADRFVYNGNDDLITFFDPNEDVIDLSALGYDDVQTVLAAATETVLFTTIATGEGDLTITGVGLGNLDGSNMLTGALAAMLGALPKASAEDAAALAEGFAGLVRAIAVPNDKNEPATAALNAQRKAAARRYVEDNICNLSLSTDEICRAVGVSRGAVCRAFEDAGGFAAFTLQRRIQAAHRELAQSEPRRGVVKDVAERWGFSDPAYFSKVFRRQLQRSPDGRASAISSHGSGSMVI